jgi:antitoxin VapB
MSEQRRAKLFKNGSNQSVRIPRDLELPGEEVLMWREGTRLVLEPVRGKSLREVLKSLEPLPKADRLDDVDDPPPEPVDL